MKIHANAELSISLPHLHHRILSGSFPFWPAMAQVSPLGTITSSQQERLKVIDKGDFLTPSLIKFMLMSSTALLRASDKSLGSSLLFTTSNQDYQTHLDRL